jgi:hypothetical protein
MQTYARSIECTSYNIGFSLAQVDFPPSHTSASKSTYRPFSPSISNKYDFDKRKNVHWPVAPRHLGGVLPRRTHHDYEMPPKIQVHSCLLGSYAMIGHDLIGTSSDFGISSDDIGQDYISSFQFVPRIYTRLQF